jgi:hypothetical protein
MTENDKKNLDDEDKAALERMLASREESRRKREAAAASGAAPAPAKPPGDLAKRWADEPFGGGEDEDGFAASLPTTTPVGVVAYEGPGGVTLYRDGRCRFSIAIPGKPRFVATEEGIDASCRLAELGVTVSFVMVPPQTGAEAPAMAAQVAALAGDITGSSASASALALDVPGLEAAARATLVQGTDVRDVVVLGGGAADTRGIVIVLFDSDRASVDAARADAVRDAVVGSAAFTAEPRRRIPALAI